MLSRTSALADVHPAGRGTFVPSRPGVRLTSTHPLRRPAALSGRVVNRNAYQCILAMIDASWAEPSPLVQRSWTGDSSALKTAFANRVLVTRDTGFRRFGPEAAAIGRGRLAAAHAGSRLSLETWSFVVP